MRSIRHMPQPRKKEYEARVKHWALDLNSWGKRKRGGKRGRKEEKGEREDMNVYKKIAAGYINFKHSDVTSETNSF